MPALPPLSHAYDFIARNSTADAVVPALRAAVQVIETPKNVVCSWPVSGQYGPGSRVLYYVLVAACVLARKTEWLRNACLAAALIFPAVAAVHGVALAALHVPNAVDMDIYGAFQFCSIGILTAPITVRLSTTYFNNPGRNTIFLWAGIILVGLVALTVEFFRSEAVPCVTDESLFKYGESLCGLVCSIDNGPYSPMRQGSADEIYVIPEPTVMKFGTATLFSAACCIPAILSMVSMWDKILKVNWQERFGEKYTDQPETGTNGATPERMKSVNNIIRGFLSVVEIPVFGAAVVAILVVGELNFWSDPVRWQTEPMANVGQWAPIVASALAACGSLYMLLAEDMVAAERPTSGHCNCSHHHDEFSVQNGLFISQPGPGRISEDKLSDAPIRPDAGKRRKVAKALGTISKLFGTAAPETFDDSEFQHGKASDYPQIPGEPFRHPNLALLEQIYNTPRAEDDDRGRRRSRANSFTGSVAGFTRPSPPSSSRALSPNPPSRPELTTSSLQIVPGGSSRPDANSGRASHDSGPRHNDNPDTASPSVRPGSSLTIQPSGFNSPSIVVSAETEPVGILTPPPVHKPPS
ncbi:hypothetical protein QBC40DRAFT_282281 [Triangularia verruculosa]|uniref:Uncharacterized protein n=1 Tax=Triangularia verruculosa TaxID=2587418 RepID=A0AAN7AUQ0_9PEZI|nr:hypothetical protein QBC40DRAFT_282281 [Triangularia verruculosa]